jgi:hypothetical protein
MESHKSDWERVNPTKPLGGAVRAMSTSSALSSERSNAHAEHYVRFSWQCATPLSLAC